MKKSLVTILALALLLIFPAAALADADCEIVAQGTAVVLVAPDMANINFGVSELGEDVAAAQSAVNQKIAAIITTLGAAGISAEDIATDSIYLYAQYDYKYDTGEQVFQGYQATQTLMVKVRNIDMVGSVIDGAFAAGANQFNYVSFTLSDDTAARDEALKLAVQDGMRKAKLIAEAAGVALPAAPDLIEETTFALGTLYGGSVYRSAYADEGGMGTEPQAGMLEISASVRVVYGD